MSEGGSSKILLVKNLYTTCSIEWASFIDGSIGSMNVFLLLHSP